jgi:DNA polymerase I
VRLTDQLVAAGVRPGQPLAVTLAPGVGLGLAWAGGHRGLDTEDPMSLVAELETLAPRWVWWTARGTAASLVAAGVRPRACWDVGAVARLLHGLSRDDPGASWAAVHGLDEPPESDGELTLLDLAGEDSAAGAVRSDGQLSREWLRGAWADDLDDAARWAALALETQSMQEDAVRRLPDPRATSVGSPLPYLTALSESMAALLAVELERDGLPIERGVLERLLSAAVGPRPRSEAEEATARRARDAVVWREFPGEPVDLRNPALVRDLLARVGIEVPDTRSWRLEPYAESSPAVAALLAWRKSERIATTYGWSWAERDIGADDRLRGVWGASEGAGRMTASAGLHNLPAELRSAVRAAPGRVLVRADLGQIEPRVLATVAGDRALAEAAREDDMYAPVAKALGSDRPTAKVAVLAAMYGQTSGPAGAALKDMDRTYPTAMAFLRAAEESGRRGIDVRTYGGRLLRLSSLEAALREAGPDSTLAHSYGRFARNAVVQGAAAELFKAWAATVRAGISALDARIVLCLHDELLVECIEQESARVVEIVDAALASTGSWWCAGSGVRLVSDTSVVKGWDEAK